MMLWLERQRRQGQTLEQITDNLDLALAVGGSIDGPRYARAPKYLVTDLHKPTSPD